jgi:hypothetical protein
MSFASFAGKAFFYDILSTLVVTNDRALLLGKATQLVELPMIH